MKNLFVFGGRDIGESYLQAIKNLEKEKYWDIKFQLADSRNGNAKGNVVNIRHFLNDKWLVKYPYLIRDYQSGIKTDEKIYEEVYSHLYQFQDCYSRFHDYKFFEFHFDINYFNLLLNFFYSVFRKEKIDLVIFSAPPHHGVDNIIYWLARAMNIQVLSFEAVGNFLNKMACIDKIEDIGIYHRLEKQVAESDLRIPREFKKDLYYMAKVRPLRRPRLRLRDICRPRDKMARLYRYLLNRTYYKNMKSRIKEIDYSKKYVYFGLHFQPESTTSAMGGIYCDQLLAVERLRALLPDDWFIYVKEHPVQDAFMRPDIFFKRLDVIPNTQFISPAENTYRLLEHAQFAATITGTLGYEAITGGKPALIFGHVWYKQCPGVFRYHENLNYQDIINFKIDHEELENSINELLRRCCDGTVDASASIHVKDYDQAAETERMTIFLRNIVSEL